MSYEGCLDVLMAEDRSRTEKLWGWEDEVVNTPAYCGKVLHLEPGYVSSLHYHNKKDETFLCVEGVVGVEIGGQIRVLMAMGGSWDSLRVMPRTPHRFWAIGGPARLVEFSTHHSDGDVERLEESRVMEDGWK